jgi:aspartyl-tRNA(Asn)/glutamyl-tRNA(Gln) amidotransferase subunit A
VNARRALQEARMHAAEIFANDIDLIVLPTWKRLPTTLVALQKGKWGVARELWNTQPFNVLGLPAISVPCGFSKAGLPVGMQIVGKPFADMEVLAFAHAYQQATSWHLRRPTL